MPWQGPIAPRCACTMARTCCDDFLQSQALMWLDSTCGYLASRPANRRESSPGEGIPWISGYRM
jgi:hypothetical protein